MKMPVLLICLWLLLAGSTSIKLECEFNITHSKEHLKLSERQILVKTLYPGVDMIVDDHDSTVSRLIKQTGSWQPFNVRAVARLVKKGDTILNIGSHVGLEAIVLAKITGNQGKLFIFQPYSLSYRMMVKNIYLNNLEFKTHAYNLGGSDKKSKGQIAVWKINTGSSEIYNSTQSVKQSQALKDKQFQIEEISLDRVDDVLPPDAIINFAMIDVERMEIACLLGMKDVIARSPNIIIIAEWSGWSHQPNYQEKKQQLVNWLVEKKFKFYDVPRQLDTCNDLYFPPTTPEKVKTEQFYVIFPQILIVPEHIDPNTLH